MEATISSFGIMDALTRVAPLTFLNFLDKYSSVINPISASGRKAFQRSSFVRIPILKFPTGRVNVKGANRKCNPQSSKFIFILI